LAHLGGGQTKESGLEIIGGSNIRVYAPKDEGSHPFGQEPWWQESVFLFWYDLKAGAGGMHRIGHEPHLRDGSVVLYNYFFTSDDAIYKNTQILPIRSDDRFANGFGGGPSCRFEYDGRPIWTFDDEHASGRLEFEDHHPPIDLFPQNAGTVADDFAKNHLEASGRVTGRVTIGGKGFTIDAVGFRDHSWGVRVWPSLLTHRWVAGVFGPSHSFCALSWLGEDGTLRKFGFLIRGEKVIYANDVDIVTAIEVDGVTHRGGKVRMALANGELAEVTVEPLAKGILSFHHNVAMFDMLCRATMGEHVGICDFETTNNSQQGAKRPTNLIRGVIDNGFYPASGA
jgi:hypothetical protein